MTILKENVTDQCAPLSKIKAHDATRPVFFRTFALCIAVAIKCLCTILTCIPTSHYLIKHKKQKHKPV